MPSHMWGDEWFEKHGNDLDSSISYCMTVWKTYGRIGTHGKEKYGTFRDHIYMWDGGIHSLIWPGYVSIQSRFIAYKIDPAVKLITRYTGLLRLGWWYQKQVYNFAIQRVCKKFPEIVDELVSSLNGYEFIQPGIFGPIDGNVIHKKYWTTYE